MRHEDHDAWFTRAITAEEGFEMGAVAFAAATIVDGLGFRRTEAGLGLEPLTDHPPAAPLGDRAGPPVSRQPSNA